jgi:hypothetical protein
VLLLASTDSFFKLRVLKTNVRDCCPQTEQHKNIYENIVADVLTLNCIMKMLNQIIKS